MPHRIRWLGLVPLIVLAAVALLWQGSSSEASAGSPRVIIKDNDAPAPRDAFDPDQARWRFNPVHVTVKRGESVVFESKAENHHPHTVTALRRTSPPNTVPASFSGVPFDSGSAFIEPGGTFTLDTSSVPVGVYGYVCRLHPWMSGILTVE